jgi:hypothetical protein
VSKRLLEVFPAGDASPPLFVTNKLVRQKMCEMRVEMRALVDAIRDSSNDNKWGTYVDYSSQFPLQSFVSWYLSWAQNLLRACGEGLSSSKGVMMPVQRVSLDTLVVRGEQEKGGNDR